MALLVLLAVAVGLAVCACAARAAIRAPRQRAAAVERYMATHPMHSCSVAAHWYRKPGTNTWRRAYGGSWTSTTTASTHL